MISPIKENDRTKNLLVSVVCPFYNEESIIGDSIVETIKHLENQFADTAELILVDDGSTDTSLDCARKAIRASKKLRVQILHYPLNQGRGRALKTGINAAEGEIVVTTESDGSWGFNIVSEIVDKLQNSNDLDFVIASPHRSGGGFVNVDKKRVWLSRYGNLLIRLFFESKVTMNTGMTRGYRRRVIQPLDTQENGKEFHLEVLLKLMAIGFKFDEVPATLEWPQHRVTRKTPKKRKSSTKLIRTIFTHLKFVLIAHPVKYFGIISLCFFSLGCLFFALALQSIFAQGNNDVQALLLAVNLMVVGLVLGGVAVIMHLLRDLLRYTWRNYYDQSVEPTAFKVAKKITSKTKR